MNILKQLSIRNLKLNKKRTISTVIGIILSCSLICAVASMFTSFRETAIQDTVRDTGYYHLKIMGVTDEIDTLKNNRDIKDIYTLNEIGFGKLENIQNENKPYLKLSSMDENLFDHLNLKLVEGQFPVSSNEVLISKHIIDNGKVDLKIGDKIIIDVGQRVGLNDEILNNDSSYAKENEKLINTQKYEFTISGIIERPSYKFESYSSPGYTIITTNLNTGSKNAYISLKNPVKYKTVIPEILGASSYNNIEGQTGLKYANFSINDELLRWEVFAFSDETINVLFTIGGIVIFIILVTSVFCIRNSFAIATTEKMKMYGMLTSIGATKKQIKKNVIFEGLILGLIGIPLGVLSGIFAVFVLIKIVNSIAGDFLLGNINGLVMKITITPIIISVLLSILTIYLSSISSAKKASKASPIEVLRNAEEIKIKAKKLKVPKIITKIFKTGGELSYKNLKRSKKKYRTTVISLTVSIFVFITMNTFITNAFDVSNVYYKDYDYNINVYTTRGEIQNVDRIIKCNNIDEYYLSYETKRQFEIMDLSKLNEEFEDAVQEDGYYDEKQDMFIPSGKGKKVSIQIITLDNDTFSKYAKKIGANYNKVKDKGILCDEYMYQEDNKLIYKRMYKYSKGDVITGKIDDKDLSIEVGFVSDIKPYGYESHYNQGGYLVLNNDEYKGLDSVPVNLAIQSSNPEELEKEIKKIDNDLRCINFEENERESKAMVLIVKIFLYGFIAVITLIGVTNIFNTINSNIELRQKEFAMFKSIGMTKKEFNRMINLETIFYSTKSLIYGITMGLIGTFALYKSFSMKIEKGIYIPVNPIIISIVAVFILVFIIMKYSISKVNKQNTIETIRNENI